MILNKFDITFNQNFINRKTIFRKNWLNFVVERNCSTGFRNEIALTLSAEQPSMLNLNTYAGHRFAKSDWPKLIAESGVSTQSGAAV